MDGVAVQETTAPAVTFVGVAHEGIPCSVTKLDACIEFYKAVLDLKLLKRPKALDDIGPGAWLGDAHDRVQFHLIAKDDEYRPGPDAKIARAGRHTAWMVENLDVLRDRLRDKNIYFEELNNLIGSPQLFVTDPEGHTWEFQQLARPAA